MPNIVIEQAFFVRPPEQMPFLQARSAGFTETWLPEVEQLLLGFGERQTGIPCPAAVFAQPLGKDQVAVIQVADQLARAGEPALGFHVLVLPRAAYRLYLGDPFAIADLFFKKGDRVLFEGLDDKTPLSPLSLPAVQLPARTVDDVRQVLHRVKAGALREDEDPHTIELNVDNAESPALLGGVQILVDGGKLVFVRRAPDPGLIRGLWMLLPSPTRSELWPATFAYSNALGFDALVVPRRGDEDFSEYNSEEQASDYPAGRYELSLQTAAEAGDQAGLDALFNRRTSQETLRMGLFMVAVLSIAVLGLRFWRTASPEPSSLSPAQRENLANAAAITANGDPWTAVALHESNRYRQAERHAAAAAIVAVQDPFAAAVQARTAYARYVEIWEPEK
jgi:hypothetical protein